MSFPNLTVNAIELFVDKGNLFFRITVSLVVIILSCIFIIIFIFVDTTERSFGFFMLTMFTVIVLNSTNAVYQNNIFGIVGSFSLKYINDVVLGNIICGLLVTLLLIITIKAFAGDEETNAAVYFSITLCALIFCLISVFYLRKNHFYVHQTAITFREHRLPLLNIWSVFFVTLFLFLSVLFNIHLYPSTRHSEKAFDFPVDYNLYGILFVFLYFNFLYWIKISRLFYMTFNKICLYSNYTSIIPLFYICNYIPAGYRTRGVVIQNEYIVFVLIALMPLSHGYYSSVAMMYAPRYGFFVLY